MALFNKLRNVQQALCLKAEFIFLVLLWRCLGPCNQGQLGDLALDQRKWRTNINGATGGIFYIAPHGLL